MWCGGKTGSGVWIGVECWWPSEHWMRLARFVSRLFSSHPARNSLLDFARGRQVYGYEVAFDEVIIRLKLLPLFTDGRCIPIGHLSLLLVPENDKFNRLRWQDGGVVFDAEASEPVPEFDRSPHPRLPADAGAVIAPSQSLLDEAPTFQAHRPAV